MLSLRTVSAAFGYSELMLPLPVVSVVMVAFGGGWNWIPRALERLKQSTTEPYEVLVVDNGGADKRPLPADAMVELLRNRDNIGFGPGSNQGAERARAEFVCFINPDVLVRPGWLPPLLERLGDDRVGAVFPAMLNLDGTLQEAGAFVTGEAHTFTFGRDDDPDAPEHSFRREVDFGSAACMCLTRKTFELASGFDSAYRLAYFEDADLCFRLRRLGLRPVYEPRSRVEHARTVSADPAGLEQVYAANREVFLDRWEPDLAARPGFDELRENARTRLGARDLHAYPRVLVVDDSEEHAARIASNHPSAVVTLLAEGPGQGGLRRRLTEAGVEVALTDRADRWLKERSGHYSHVIRSENEPWQRLASTIRSTQPGASIVDATRFEELRKQAAAR